MFHFIYSFICKRENKCVIENNMINNIILLLLWRLKMFIASICLSNDVNNNKWRACTFKNGCYRQALVRIFLVLSWYEDYILFHLLFSFPLTSVRNVGQIKTEDKHLEFPKKINLRECFLKKYKNLITITAISVVKCNFGTELITIAWCSFSLCLSAIDAYRKNLSTLHHKIVRNKFASNVLIRDSRIGEGREKIWQIQIFPLGYPTEFSNLRGWF